MRTAQPKLSTATEGSGQGGTGPRPSDTFSSEAAVASPVLSALPDAVALEGRLQSRTYIKRVGEEKQERTAFEVSITSIDVLNPK